MKKIIRNIIFICSLFTIGVLCVTYIATHINIEWYWFGLGLAGGIIGVLSSILLLAYTIASFDEYLYFKD